MRVVIRPRPSTFQGGLFEAPWQAAAQEWAASWGMVIDRWQVDQRIRVGGVWYAVAWSEPAEAWQVDRVEEG